MTYTDYNGTERTEDFYFNLSKAELIEMELGTSGGLSEMIKRIVDAKDIPTITKVFKDLVLKAYGVKSLDGKRFEKSEELSRAFAQTEAYSDMIVEFLSDENAGANFVKGILPVEVDDKALATLLPNTAQ